MQSLAAQIVWPLLAVLATTGCTAINAGRQTGESPLTSTKMSADSVVLEILRVDVPCDDPAIGSSLWEEIDEQHFPAQLRRKLQRNGFRVGLVGSPIPEVLSRLLDLEDNPPPTGEAVEIDLADMDCQAKVQRRRIQIRAGHRAEIVTSGVRDKLPVLLWDAGQVSGQTYAKAQTLLSLKAFPNDDGRVRLELLPELYHDESRQRWVAGQGTLRLQAGRPSRTFDQLAISAVLSPGEMLLITAAPDRPGSLGHHFFTEGETAPKQKLLVIRLAQTQHDDLFSGPPPL